MTSSEKQEEIRNYLNRIAKEEGLEELRIEFKEGCFPVYTTGNEIKVSPGLIDRIGVEEAKALVSHEIGHILYNHHQKRISKVPHFLFLIFVLLFPTVYLIKILGYTDWLIPLSSVFYSILAFRFISKKYFREMEMQADDYAKKRLKDHEVVFKALKQAKKYQNRKNKTLKEKIRVIIQKILSMILSQHPPLEKREKNLKKSTN